MVRMSRDRFEHLLSLAAQKGIGSAQSHFAEVEATRGTLPVRMRRGFFRLWVALSAVWCVVIVAAAVMHGSVPNLAGVAAFAIVPPLLVLLAGAALAKLSVWVWNGFRGGP
jgi:hypothetical protein